MFLTFPAIRTLKELITFVLPWTSQLARFRFLLVETEKVLHSPLSLKIFTNRPLKPSPQTFPDDVPGFFWKLATYVCNTLKRFPSSIKIAESDVSDVPAVPKLEPCSGDGVTPSPGTWTEETVSSAPLWWKWFFINIPWIQTEPWTLRFLSNEF